MPPAQDSGTDDAALPEDRGVTRLAHQATALAMPDAAASGGAFSRSR